MRIDKFLWSIRFYKTRNIAAEEIKKNRVSIGANPVKSSKEVKEGDVIKIRRNQIDYKIKVLQIPKSRIGAKLVPLHITEYSFRKNKSIQKKNYQEEISKKKNRKKIKFQIPIDLSIEIWNLKYWNLKFIRQRHIRATHYSTMFLNRLKVYEFQ